MENDRTANDAFSTTDIETATIKSPPEASSPILMLEGDTLDTSKVKDEKVADQQPPETDGTTEAERSSSESSDSSDSSDSDDSNDKELEEEIKKIRDSGMDEENEAVEGASIKSKNEVVNLPPVEVINIVLTEDVAIAELGLIDAVIDQVVVVKSLVCREPGTQMTNLESNPLLKEIFDAPPALQEESLLCFSDRTILGRIFEVFGPVRQPFYSVRFNSKEEMPPHATINAGVFYVLEHSSTVFAKDIYCKGTDASNEFDEEIPAEEQEFSDDEKEAQVKERKKKSKKRVREARKPPQQALGQREQASHLPQVKKARSESENNFVERTSQLTAPVLPSREEVQGISDSYLNPTVHLPSQSPDDVMRSMIQLISQNLAHAPTLPTYFPPVTSQPQSLDIGSMMALLNQNQQQQQQQQLVFQLLHQQLQQQQQQQFFAQNQAFEVSRGLDSQPPQGPPPPPPHQPSTGFPPSFPQNYQQ